MQKDIQIAAFEGGALHVKKTGKCGREAVLALPLSRLIVKMVRVAPEEDPVTVATTVLQALSPYPDEPLTVSCETVCESEAGSVVLAAALPEDSAEDLAELLDARKLNVTRVDLLVLGQLRNVWSRFDASDGRRRLVEVRSPDCLTLLVLDGDQPVAIRGLTDSADFEREKTLILLDAESFGGEKPVFETITVEPSAEEAFDGLVARAEDPSTLNALPATWAEVLTESRFKARLTRHLAVAGGIWLLAMGVLFGVPIGYDFLTDHQKGLSRQKQHARLYAQVREKKLKVEAFKPYSDHSRSALEIMKAVSERLPEGITLSDWNFECESGLKIRGDAENDSLVLSFKNEMEALAFGETGERVFASVRLGNLNLLRDRQRFDLELGFTTEEEEP